ncbi:MAG: iron-sulfur cluster assembly scaffold protein [Desulfobacterales bacterium]|jgi:nitrogen fixation NifU-like protein|nr:iron-sulfur cluster assembly scaffold protein [Desulfobacteraceae bacterium]MDY0311399.1 iron-sulfur cluster assembly scaffold protein [Desulfobacterales bacterium]
MNLISLLLGIGVLLVIALAWFAVYYWLNPHVASPDGKARVVGICGDVMEISLKFKDDRVSEGSSWTNGCAHSFNCVCAAVDMAKGKSAEEILDIDGTLIQNAVGGLPRDHWHCAGLAAETLHAAVDNYMQTNLGLARQGEK